MDDDPLSYYRRELTRHRYTAEERATLIELAYHDHDARVRAAARRKLFHVLLWLPMRLARRFAWGEADLEDLVQAGNVSMLISLNSWKPDGGAKLLTWIRWGILRDMKRENARARVVPNSDFEFSYDTTDAETLDVIYADSDARALEQEAMLDPAASAEPQDHLFQADSDVWVRVRALDPEERDVLMSLYFDAQSLRDVAEHMQISHTQVARLRDNALRTLQRSYENG